MKGHLQPVSGASNRLLPVCIALMHFTEIICCHTEITNVLIVFENRIVS